MTATRIMAGLVPALALMLGTTAAAFPQSHNGQSNLISKAAVTSASVAPISTGDAATGDEVSAALNKDRSLRLEDIRVQSALGVITLTGAVESTRQSQRAEQIASAVKGVKAINNQLTIITLSSELDSGNGR
jgi:hyperosmotically inducible periplasmic protein